VHDNPIQKYFYRRISRFYWIFVVENTAAEDLAMLKIVCVETTAK